MIKKTASKMMKLKLTCAYVVSIVLCNVGFSYVPLVPVAGVMFPPMSILVGLVFVLRDYAQREIGHGVLGAMAAGALISFIMADPFVAFASLTAFVVAESLDWLFYTLSPGSFRRRVLISSVVSTPADSAVFLLLIGAFSPLAVLLMTTSKMLAVVAVFINQRKV